MGTRPAGRQEKKINIKPTGSHRSRCHRARALARVYNKYNFLYIFYLHAHVACLRVCLTIQGVPIYSINVVFTVKFHWSLTPGRNEFYNLIRENGTITGRYSNSSRARHKPLRTPNRRLRINVKFSAGSSGLFDVFIRTVWIPDDYYVLHYTSSL